MVIMRQENRLACRLWEKGGGVKLEKGDGVNAGGGGGSTRDEGQAGGGL